MGPARKASPWAGGVPWAGAGGFGGADDMGGVAGLVSAAGLGSVMGEGFAAGPAEAGVGWTASFDAAGGFVDAAGGGAGDGAGAWGAMEAFLGAASAGPGGVGGGSGADDLAGLACESGAGADDPLVGGALSLGGAAAGGAEGPVAADGVGRDGTGAPPVMAGRDVAVCCLVCAAAGRPDGVSAGRGGRPPIRLAAFLSGPGAFFPGSGFRLS